MEKRRIVCFGEVLWDEFPTYKEMGGAPLNVALRLASFGNDVAMISKVGDDALGKDLIAFIDKEGLDIDNIQVDQHHETGRVQVTLDQTGSATYEIKFPAAWDFIDVSDNLKKLVGNADAFVFGSLVSRNIASKSTLLALLKKSKYKVFDVNLRKPHYTKEILIALMNEANFIKFNDDELLELSRYLGSHKSTIEANIQFISEMTKTPHICVTKGGKGAVLFYDGTLYCNQGYKIEVVDTVGAGDSFLATLISQLLNQDSKQKALDIACAVGALVAGSKGANPVITPLAINELMNN